MIVVYHGTGRWAYKSLMTQPIECKPRYYIPGAPKAFCTTTDPEIAKLFALRRTTFDDLRQGHGGLLFRYEIVNGAGYIFAEDSRSLQKEHEVAVTDPFVLDLTGVWENVNDDWKVYGGSEGDIEQRRELRVGRDRKRRSLHSRIQRLVRGK